MDRTTKTLIAVFTLVAALLLGTNHAVNEVALQDWWLAGLLFVVSLGFWVWLWQESEAAEEAGAIIVSGNGSSAAGVQEWIISKETVSDVPASRAADIQAEPINIEDEVDDEPETRGIPTPPEIDPDAAAELVEDDVPEVPTPGEPDLESDERAEITEEVVEALPEDSELVEEAKNGDPVAEQEVAEAMAARPAGTVNASDTMELDDLERIEGIGPKYSEALIAAGVTTFEQVASMSVEQFEAIAKEAGMRRAASMETWAEQARLAAASDWDGLDAFQQDLTGGRRDENGS